MYYMDKMSRYWTGIRIADSDILIAYPETKNKAKRRRPNY